MRAGFGLNPRRLRRKGHIFISYLEQCLNFRFSDEENDIMCSNALLTNYARNVFDVLERHLVQEGEEDLSLKADRGHLFQGISCCIFKVYPVILVVFFQDDFIVQEQIFNLYAFLLNPCEIANFYGLYLGKLRPDMEALLDILDDSVLLMDDDVLTGEEQGLNPLILLLLAFAEQVILVCGLHAMMSVQDVQIVHCAKLGSEGVRFLIDPPQSVLAAVMSSPRRKLLFLSGEINDQTLQLNILPVADHHWSHVLPFVGLAVEVGPMQRFLVSLNAVLVVILSLRVVTCMEISPKRPKEVCPIQIWRYIQKQGRDSRQSLPFASISVVLKVLLMGVDYRCSILFSRRI